MTVDKDHRIAAALATLAPPPPHPRFWADLAERIEHTTPADAVSANDGPAVTPASPPAPDGAAPGGDVVSVRDVGAFASGGAPAHDGTTPVDAVSVRGDERSGGAPARGAGGGGEGRSGDVVVALAAEHRSHRRRGVAMAAAAAVAVLAFGAVVGLAGQDEEVELGPMDDPAPAPLVEPGPPADRGQQPPGPAEQGAEAAAVATARQWVEAVGAGDVERAWALVGEQSRAGIGGRAAFEDLMATDLPATWAPWAPAPGTGDPGADVEMRAVAIGDGPEAELWAVTFQGRPEPGDAYRVAGLAVRVDGGGSTVEPFVPGTGVGLIDLPLPGDGDGDLPTVGPGDPIRVHVDADAPAAAVALDGRPVAGADLERNVDGSVVAVRLPPDLPPGEHALTVAFTTPTGTLALDTAAFRSP